MSLKIQKGLKICDRLYQNLKHRNFTCSADIQLFQIQRTFLQFQNGDTYLEKNNKESIKGHIRQSLKLLEKFCFLNYEIPLDKLSLQIKITSHKYFIIARFH